MGDVKVDPGDLQRRPEVGYLFQGRGATEATAHRDMRTRSRS